MTIPKELNILITPTQTMIGDKICHPTTISVVLENGHSYDLDLITTLLTKHDKKTHKGPGLFKRTKRFFQAVKQVMKEESYP